ncbi:MAG: AAA family ATPase [Candidatus Yonathbacteria bacterium]|nr:AAA family ATPase [Candidatus Yonathbacteria bacterium]
MLKSIEISGFKSFAKKGELVFSSPVSAIVGPNGSGKSNVTEAMRFVLGEQSMKSLRSKRGEDLIWSGSQAAPRANRASVEMVFDNRGRVFDMAFDEVSIKRVVSRDGTNEYFVNGSPVRLKDVMELLAQVHIGASGHHIISQGEADRILNTSSKERRNIIEDALGLKIYHWKIAESEKKLSKTEENMKEVESLRREIAPHIRFLKKQVEKIEAAEALRTKLATLYAEYLKRESVYLAHATREVGEGIAEKEATLARIDQEMKEAQEHIARSTGEVREDPRIAELDGQIAALRAEKDEQARMLGRIEGMMDAVKRRRERMHKETDRPIAHALVTPFVHEVKGYAEEGERTDDIGVARAACASISQSVGDFSARIREGTSDEEMEEADLEYARLEKEYADVSMALESFVGKEDGLYRERVELRRSADQEKGRAIEAERAVYTLRAERSEVAATLGRLRDKETIILRDKTAFDEELREGSILVGRAILEYDGFACDESEAIAESRAIQEERRRAIERIKIKLEDAGVGGGGDVMKEYGEVTERDAFLERELTDLGKGAMSLRELIVELRTKLDVEFKDGLRSINTQFQEYFALMFGGGTASLEVVKQKKRVRKDAEIPDEATAEEYDEEGLNADKSASAEEEGIDIAVSLPRKKIHGLQMLSGGERALTSIALIFAVSQVNPPPFLVLDETDAALDEANSRRYGDMLENLAKHSQLIVVTHNRETMSRAGVLYGVTMGSDAASRLLSVKFEEASVYAK